MTSIVSEQKKTYGQVQIGEGAYSKIYDIGNEKVYKDMIIKEKPDSNAIEKSFVKELTAIHTLNNIPKIIQIIDVCNKSNKVGYTMKRYYKSLDKLLGKFTPLRTKKIIYQLLQAVYYSHDACVVHQDIKPANILLDQNDNLVLADWSLARFEYSKNQLGRTPDVQTLWYRSPEVLLDLANYNYKIDIWSVGIVMLDMLYNRYIFQGSETVTDQLIRITQFFGNPENYPIYKTRSKEIFKIPIITQSRWSIIDAQLIMKGVSKSAINLLKCLLDFNPNTRIDAKTALEHEYFKNIHDPNYDKISPYNNIKINDHIITNIHKYNAWYLKNNFRHLVINQLIMFAIHANLNITDISIIQRNLELILGTICITPSELQLYIFIMYDLFMVCFMDYEIPLCDFMSKISHEHGERFFELERRLFSLLDYNMFCKTSVMIMESCIAQSTDVTLNNLIRFYSLAVLYDNEFINYHCEMIAGSIASYILSTYEQYKVNSILKKKIAQYKYSVEIMAAFANLDDTKNSETKQFINDQLIKLYKDYQPYN